MLKLVVFGLGIFVLCRILLFWARFVNRHFIRRPQDLMAKYGDKESWVCVTGATSGIGQSFCELLAQAGFNILLVSRTESKLKDTSESIKKRCPNVKTAYIIADFEKSETPNFWKDLKDQLARYEISIMINNAGYANMCRVHTEDEVELKKMVQTNCLPYVLITKYVLDKMMKRDKRSAVIHVGSIASIMALPVGAVYAATKAFDDYFSRGITYEVKEKVDVICLRPGMVSTNMSKAAISFTCISSETCARGTLRDLGYESYTYSSWIHELMAEVGLLMVSLLPESIFHNFMLSRSLGMEKKIKARKAEQSKKD